MRVVWTEQALQRLIEIEDFVAADDPVAAVGIVDRLVECGGRLSHLPQRGRRVPELPDSGLRQVVEGNYRLIYRVRQKDVQVLTVFEGHRLLRRDEL
jgi:plasmid stabilization system protein ParE